MILGGGAEGGGAAATVVMGLGNPCMGDDGAGLAALEALHREVGDARGIEWVDGGTAALSLLPIVESARRLLLLDAIDAGAEPGAVVVLEGEEVPARLAPRLSPHQIDLSELLALASLRGRRPPVLVAIGVQPSAIGCAEGLSESVSEALGEVVARAHRTLRAWIEEDAICGRRVVDR